MGLEIRQQARPSAGLTAPNGYPTNIPYIGPNNAVGLGCQLFVG